mmetsp:Transcript_132954/g.384409  ORF Transcript_132954/g.384409 Transcript_132954/m.384409 type:complete len:320 (-) Transcript_132954:515-1474(-)
MVASFSKTRKRLSFRHLRRVPRPTLELREAHLLILASCITACLRSSNSSMSTFRLSSRADFMAWSTKMPVMRFETAKDTMPTKTTQTAEIHGSTLSKAVVTSPQTRPPETHWYMVKSVRAKEEKYSRRTAAWASSPANGESEPDNSTRRITATKYMNTKNKHEVQNKDLKHFVTDARMMRNSPNARTTRMTRNARKILTTLITRNIDNLPASVSPPIPYLMISSTQADATTNMSNKFQNDRQKRKFWVTRRASNSKRKMQAKTVSMIPNTAGSCLDPVVDRSRTRMSTWAPRRITFSTMTTPMLWSKYGLSTNSLNKLK